MIHGMHNFKTTSSYLMSALIRSQTPSQIKDGTKSHPNATGNNIPYLVITYLFLTFPYLYPAHLQTSFTSRTEIWTVSLVRVSGFPEHGTRTVDTLLF